MSSKNGNHRRSLVAPGVHGVSRVTLEKVRGGFNKGQAFALPTDGLDVLVKLAQVGATAAVLLSIPESETDRIKLAEVAHLEALKLFNPDGDAATALAQAAAMLETIATKLRRFSGLDEHLAEGHG